MKQTTSIAYRCKRNGETVKCEVCNKQVVHHVAELLPPPGQGVRIPYCETHGIRLVRA